MKPEGLGHAGLAGRLSSSGVLPAHWGVSYNQEVTWGAGINIEATGWGWSGVKQEKKTGESVV